MSGNFWPLGAATTSDARHVRDGLFRGDAKHMVRAHRTMVRHILLFAVPMVVWMSTGSRAMLMCRRHCFITAGFIGLRHLVGGEDEEGQQNCQKYAHGSLIV